MNSEFLLGTRLALHLATILILAGYWAPSARFRLGPSVMAGLLLSSSAGLAVQAITKWDVLVQHGPQPQLVFFVFTVFLLIAWSRGNVAKIYDGLVSLRPCRWWPRR